MNCEGPTLTTSTYMRWKPIAFGAKRPRTLACFASTVNKLVACFASSSERQKRQRYFKALLLHAEVVYFPHIFRYSCLLHISINYTENVTDLYAHAQTVDTRRSSPIFQVPGYEASVIHVQVLCIFYKIVVLFVS